MKRFALSVALITLVASTAFAADTTRWLNVHVTEPASSTNVEVHLPMSLVVSVLKGIKVDNFDAGKIDLDLDGAEIDWPQIMAALSDAPDGHYVTVDSDEADVRVKKENGLMLVHVTEKSGDNAVVDVRLPMGLVDLITIDEANRIDVAALIESIVDLPDGELVSVTSDEANVRVWVE
jgi:hypothetical protein